MVAQCMKRRNRFRKYCDYQTFALSGHARLVNHQFKAEAEKQCAKSVFLKVDDESLAGYAQPLQKFFPTFELSRITSLEYRSTISHRLEWPLEKSGNYGGMQDQLQMHSAWIRESIPHLDHLRGIKIELDMRWTWRAGSCPFPVVHNLPELFDTMNQITDVPFLTSVVVRRRSMPGLEWSDSLKVDPWDWVRRDKGEGWRMVPQPDDQVCEDGLAEQSKPSTA